jgi:hypothetical protein
MRKVLSLLFAVLIISGCASTTYQVKIPKAFDMTETVAVLTVVAERSNVYEPVILAGKFNANYSKHKGPLKEYENQLIANYQDAYRTEWANHGFKLVNINDTLDADTVKAITDVIQLSLKRGQSWAITNYWVRQALADAGAQNLIVHIIHPRVSKVVDHGITGNLRVASLIGVFNSDAQIIGRATYLGQNTEMGAADLRKYKPVVDDAFESTKRLIELVAKKAVKK